MELRVLNYFLAIAREENITKAAQTLHVTQPTLSRQIAQLEEELGVKLFVRSNHNISLTEDGMILKRRAQEIISLADKTKKDFMNKEETLSGEIAIGSGEFQSTRFLSRLIAAFKEKYPLVRYEIYSGNTGNIQDNIERGLLDIGLINEPVDIRKYDFVSTSQKEKWGIMVKKDSELAGKESIRPDELIGYPLIIPSGDFIKSFIEKNKPQMAILTVPKAAIHSVAEELISYGITAFMNFSYTELPETEGIIVENVHLSDSLMRLSYKLLEKNESKANGSKDNKENNEDEGDGIENGD